MASLSPEWSDFINTEMAKPYMVELRSKVADRRKEVTVFPSAELTFNAFLQCPYEDLKVVILGVEPGNMNGYAHGLAYSSKAGMTVALRNIFNEIFDDYFNGNTGGIDVSVKNDLTQWCSQGVLLLNKSLTSEEGGKNSHAEFGWNTFTENAIKFINQHKHKLVWMLWGKAAQEYIPLINDTKHLILTAEAATHPKFSGCKHFTKANNFIKKSYMHQVLPINWAILHNPAHLIKEPLWVNDKYHYSI